MTSLRIYFCEQACSCHLLSLDTRHGGSYLFLSLGLLIGSNEILHLKHRFSLNVFCFLFLVFTNIYSFIRQTLPRAHLLTQAFPKLNSPIHLCSFWTHVRLHFKYHWLSFCSMWAYSISLGIYQDCKEVKQGRDLGLYLCVSMYVLWLLLTSPPSPSIEPSDLKSLPVNGENCLP